MAKVVYVPIGGRFAVQEAVMYGWNTVGTYVSLENAKEQADDLKNTFPSNVFQVVDLDAEEGEDGLE